MNRHLLILATFASFFLLYSFSGGPPTGRTGAPGEGLCTGCHGGGGPGLDGNVSITGLPSTIIGGNTYTITVRVTNPNGVSQGAGFQMTALDENNQKVGTLTNPSSGSKVHSSGPRDYHDHTARRPFSGGATTWSVDWTAPSPPADLDVTLWAAGNITDGNPSFTSSGDRIVTTNASGTIQGSGSPVTVDIIASTDVTCFGGNDGSATASASGGAGGFTYSWSNGQNGPTATNLSQGTYTVTATDANSEMATDQITIQQPASPTSIMLISQQNVSCYDGNNGSAQVQASGNNGGFSYNWPNGQNGPFANNLRAGSYTVTATDMLGCQETLIVNITEPDEIEVDIITMNATCVSDSSGFALLRPEGGMIPYTFEWSNGFSNMGSSSEQHMLPPKDYSVEVTDANGCTIDVMFTIGQDSGLIVEVVSIDTPSCPGNTDGGIEVEVSGGTPPYDYDWSTGDSTRISTGLTSGTYILTVTDENGCEETITVVVPDRDRNTIEVLSPTQVECPDDSITVRFTYSGGGWNGPSGDTIEITSSDDTILYMLSDPNGCEQTDTILITYSDSIAPVIMCPGDTTTGSCTFSYNFPEVTDNCDSVHLSVLQGPQPGQIFPAGVTEVILVALDQSGNSDTCAFEVNILNDLELQASILDSANCAGDTTTYVLHGSGGSGALSVVYDRDTTPLTGDSLIVDLTDETTITLIDTTGCFDQITIGPNLVAMTLDSVVVMQMSGPGENDGKMAVYISGGTQPYSYNWMDGSGRTVGDSIVLEDLGPGDYTCTVTDANGCELTIGVVSIELITSAQDVQNERISVYPNPFNNVFNIESTSNIQSVQIINSHGELMVEAKTYNKLLSYNTTFLPTGIYFIVVQTEANLYTRRIVKQ